MSFVRHFETLQVMIDKSVTLDVNRKFKQRLCVHTRHQMNDLTNESSDATKSFGHCVLIEMATTLCSCEQEKRNYVDPLMKTKATFNE